MSTIIWVVIAVVAVLVIVAAALVMRRRARTAQLRERFGPEYDRAVEQHHGRGEAERELRSREERHQELDLRPLDSARRTEYRERWTRVQEQFVDTPEDAVAEADRLVMIVMSERGYPTEDFEDRVAHLSVEHGRTLDHYRSARDISVRAGRKEASTEDLRQAMVHYRALFEDLLAVPDGHSDDPVATPPDPTPTPEEAHTGDGGAPHRSEQRS